MRRSSSLVTDERSDVSTSSSDPNYHRYNSHHSNNHFAPGISQPPKLSKLNTREIFLLHRASTQPLESSRFDIDFDVLDLTSERQSGPNLPIVTLPIDLFRFKHLKRLHLDCNQIRVIPNELGENLINLEILTLSNNCLKSLPNTIDNLTKLTSLHLSSNKFERFPSIICKIKSLTFLDLCSNELPSIDPEIGQLTNLASLLLFHNRIRELPPQIGQLVQLQTLWLGDNRLTKLPREIANLNCLEWNDDNFNLSSNLENNPLREPPMHVCTQGLAAIVEYFEQTDGDTKHTNNDV